MSYISIFNCYLLFIFFIFSSEQNITRGIVKIIDNVQLPVIFNANEEYLNIITIGNMYVLNKENNTIKYQNQFVGYLTPFLFFMDNEKNYFFLMKESVIKFF